jgi:hypothetical protein
MPLKMVEGAALQLETTRHASAVAVVPRVPVQSWGTSNDGGRAQGQCIRVSNLDPSKSMQVQQSQQPLRATPP